MAKLLMVVSSVRTVRLADGSDHPIGYLAEEVLEPYETFEAAGVDVVIASPEGKVPGPHHRPEPGINRRRRVRRAQAADGVKI